MALREINLIPERQLARSAARRCMRLALIASLVTVGLLGLACAAYLRFRARSAVALANPSFLLRETASAQAEIERLRQELQDMVFVGTLQGGRSSCALLSDIASAMDGQDWLTELQINSAPVGTTRQLVLGGLATDTARLGELSRALSQQGHFVQVTLRSAEEVERPAHLPEKLPARLTKFRMEAATGP